MVGNPNLCHNETPYTHTLPVIPTPDTYLDTSIHKTSINKPISVPCLVGRSKWRVSYLPPTPTPPSVHLAHPQREQLAPSARRNSLPREWAITLAKSMLGTGPRGSAIGSGSPFRSPIGEDRGANTPREGTRAEGRGT